MRKQIKQPQKLKTQNASLKNSYEKNRNPRIVRHKNTKRNQQKKPRTQKYIFLFILFPLAVFTLILIIKGIVPNKVPKAKQTPIISIAANIATSEFSANDVQDNYNPPWNLTLVNRENPIPNDYQTELVELEGGEYVDKRIYQPLMRMLEDAKEGNWNQLPLVVSGYRTEDKQRSLYNAKIKKFKKEGYPEDEAIKLAEQWVAVPGYSEHQLGFAVDLNGATYDLYLWLQENSYKYGFIFRYPANKTDITGVAEEVWHYRYVGEEAAAEIYQQGICLEEYLENLQVP